MLFSRRVRVIVRIRFRVWLVNDDDDDDDDDDNNNNNTKFIKCHNAVRRLQRNRQVE